MNALMGQGLDDFLDSDGFQFKEFGKFRIGIFFADGFVHEILVLVFQIA
jgi:hypothetical protein